MKNIYVGNLDFRTTEAELRKAFEVYGQVDRVNVVTDKDTGQQRGFAFVEMTNDPDGEKAIAGLNGTEIDGRALNVNEARPKTERPAGGRGRSSGGGGGRNRY
jgi:cold-inducible RNA-binding protein